MSVLRHCEQCNDTGVILGGGGGLGDNAASCPDSGCPWHRRPVPLAEQLRAAVAERDVFARALRLAIGSADYRESFIQHAERQLAAERGQ